MRRQIACGCVQLVPCAHLKDVGAGRDSGFHPRDEGHDVFFAALPR